MTFVLSFRDAKRERGGPVLPGRLRKVGGGDERLAENELTASADVVFLLHGFNVPRSRGEQTLLKLAQLLPGLAGAAVVACLWPGDHWTRAASYSFEGDDADLAAAELVRFITRVLAPGTVVSFAAHSLGCRVALRAVRDLPPAYPVGEMALMAAAVDDYSLAWERGFRAAAERCRRAAVLASRKDPVLRFAYPAGDLLQAFTFFWRESAGLALGYHGPRGHEATRAVVPDTVFHEQIPDSRGVSHGSYLPAQSPTAEQQAAARWTEAVLTGKPDPRY